MNCPRCGADGPKGEFCARCGVHHDGGAPSVRLHHFAAHPGEHVGVPSIFSTLLPHANHRQRHGFRRLLVSGLAAVAILWGAGLVSAAFIVAALLVPSLYLAFLHRADVYRDQPLDSLAISFGGGLALGLAVTLVVQQAIDQSAELTTGALIALIVLVPVAQEALKPLPALAFRAWRSRYTETVDGLTLGISAGLGYALAEAAVTFGPVVRTLDLRVDPSNWFVPLVAAALLVPLMQASCAGIVTGALWRRRRDRFGHLERAAVAVALAGHVIFAGVAHIETASRLQEVLVVAGEAPIVVALLLTVRMLLHAALLDEAEDLGLEELRCPHCAEDVAAGAFCPRCGGTVSAALRGSGRAAPAPAP